MAQLENVFWNFNFSLPIVKIDSRKEILRQLMIPPDDVDACEIGFMTVQVFFETYA